MRKSGATRQIHACRRAISDRLDAIRCQTKTPQALATGPGQGDNRTPIDHCRLKQSRLAGSFLRLLFRAIHLHACRMATRGWGRYQADRMISLGGAMTEAANHGVALRPARPILLGGTSRQAYVDAGPKLCARCYLSLPGRGPCARQHACAEAAPFLACEGSGP